jgi:hypothetical protein
LRNAGFGWAPIARENDVRQWSWSKRRLATIALVLLSLTALLFFPLPLSITPQDEVDAAAFAVDSLLSGRRIWTGRGLERLHDAAFIQKKKRLYLENLAGIDDSGLKAMGLLAISGDRPFKFKPEDGVIGFSRETFKDEPAAHLQFYYSYGNVGAQGYEIRVYKCLLGRYFVFVHQWVS